MRLLPITWKWLVYHVAIVVYFLIFWFAFPFLGYSVIALSSIPVLVGSWLFGFQYGITTVVGLAIGNALLLHLMDIDFIKVLTTPGSLLGNMTIIVFAIIAGNYGATYRKLRESEERYRDLVENLNDLVYTLDINGRISFASTAIERLGGWVPQEVVGRPFIEFLHPEDIDVATQAFVETINGNPTPSMLRVKHKEGHYLYARSSSRRILEEGRPVGVTGIVSDLTALRDYEEALKGAKRDADEARIKAEDANRAKGQFLANMSHEIRTPMNGVIGMLDLLIDTKPTEEQRDFILTARGSAMHLLQIINDILDFSKIEAGKMKFDMRPMNLRSEMEDIMRVFAPMVQDRPISLGLFVDPELPAEVVTDKLRLRQILINLMSNAVKFTERGEVSINARRYQASSGHVLLFSVYDTGIGIEPEKLSMLFESFYQVDVGYRKRYQGTGLGLAISKSLVEVMGGKIWVESQPGKGSVFYFTHPLLEKTPEN